VNVGVHVRGDARETRQVPGPVARPDEPERQFGTFRFDVQTRKMTWSDSIYAIYGFEAGAVVPSLELFSAHQHPDDRAIWQEGFAQVLKTGEPYCRKFRIINAKRAVRTVLTTGQGVIDESGTVTQVAGFLVDLTDTLREYHAEEVTRAVLHSAETRPLIEQAKGILMASFDLDDDQAFKLLRLHSSYANVKLREVAANLVERLNDSALVALEPRQRVAAILGALADGRGPALPVPVADVPPAAIERAAQPPSTGRIPAADLPRTLVRAVSDARQSITIADFLAPDHPLVYVNAAFEVLTGYPAADILGRNCRFLQGADTEPANVAAISKALSGGEEVRTVLRNYRRDGTPFWNELNLSGVRDETGRLTHYIGYQLDVSERVERERQLFQLAYFDALTGLPNQANVLRQLGSALGDGSSVDLLHIALGGFRFPDEPGDTEDAAVVVAGAARVLRAALAGDIVLAKLEGDAFAVIQAGGDLADTVERITTALSAPIATSLGDRRVAASVGHARRPRDGADPAELIALAASKAAERA
jgi:PAS domain S-box-containing protein